MAVYQAARVNTYSRIIFCIVFEHIRIINNILILYMWHFLYSKVNVVFIISQRPVTFAIIHDLPIQFPFGIFDMSHKIVSLIFMFSLNEYH